MNKNSFCSLFGINNIENYFINMDKPLQNENKKKNISCKNLIKPAYIDNYDVKFKNILKNIPIYCKNTSRSLTIEVREDGRGRRISACCARAW